MDINDPLFKKKNKQKQTVSTISEIKVQNCPRHWGGTIKNTWEGACGVSFRF